MFLDWLKAASGPKEKATSMRAVKITRPRLKWLTTDNDTDCAVFAMRHMETFFGKVTNYESDLTSKGVSNLTVTQSFCRVLFNNLQSLVQ